MGVLRARSGGTWIDIGTVGVPGPPGPDEVFIGPNDPGGTYDLWVDTDDTGPSLPLAVEAAAFTPVWGGLVIGTGGSPYNAGRYVFIGGPNVGDVGQLTVDVAAKFGSTGATYPANPTFTLPAGFSGVPSSDTVGTDGEPLGTMRYTDASAAQAFYGPIRYSSATAIRPIALNVGGTYASETPLSATVPFAWAVDDRLSGSITLMAKRV